MCKGNQNGPGQTNCPLSYKETRDTEMGLAVRRPLSQGHDLDLNQEGVELVKCSINDIEIEVPKGTTILEAARSLDIYIPTLCYLDLKHLGIKNKISSCRVCMVEVVGRPRLVTACSEEITEGMQIRTDSQRALRARRTSIELLLSNHPQACLSCAKNMDCELQSLARSVSSLAATGIPYQGKRSNHPNDISSGAIIKEPNKCVMCRRCEMMCNDVQTVGALSGLGRGFNSVVGTAFHADLKDTVCTYCGQCVSVCPTGALSEMNLTGKVWRALHNPNKHVVVQVAPAVRVALGEMFGLEPGEIVTGKMVSGLRRMGFDAVFDTNFGADLTVMEEASELVHRVKHGGVLPILTSCCPAWVTFIESQFPDMLDIPSSCKSPQIMLGAMIKSYYASKIGVDAKDIVSVAVMPCLAKKAEANRPELSKDHNQNVDIVISTRELGHMLQELGLDLRDLPESDFDNVLGESTGASVIFGTSGGVIEAALRTAYDMMTGESLDQVEFTNLRGLEGIRQGEVKIGDLTLRVGIAHGLGNARKLLEGVRDGVYHFDAIEIMACPGGCIGGGGQPFHHGNSEVLIRRQKAIYQVDRDKKLRKSHENPMIQQLYRDFLGEPYGELAHDLLHTHYEERRKI